jgi:hypothetical protein
MLNDSQDAKRHESSWALWRRILEIALLVAALVLLFTQPALVDRLYKEHQTLALVVVWTAAMLSYHQDAARRDPWWSILSQILAVACLVALVVFRFTRGS